MNLTDEQKELIKEAIDIHIANEIFSDKLMRKYHESIKNNLDVLIGQIEIIIK